MGEQKDAIKGGRYFLFNQTSWLPMIINAIVLIERCYIIFIHTHERVSAEKETYPIIQLNVKAFDHTAECEMRR
jgi:hypothetical protein